MAVTVLIDRRTGALAFAGEAHPADDRESAALRQTARGEGPPLMVMPMRPALARVADAVACAERLGREVPSWLRWRFGLPARLTRAVFGVRCFACDRPVTAIAARPRGEPARCEACVAATRSDGGPCESALGRAWLLVSAGLPARALCMLVAAVREEAPAADVHAVRGVVHLALGDTEGAVMHLTEALYLRPDDLRWQGWLAAAVEIQRTPSIACEAQALAPEAASFRAA
jgi:hypothetical protein